MNFYFVLCILYQCTYFEIYHEYIIVYKRHCYFAIVCVCVPVIPYVMGTSIVIPINFDRVQTFFPNLKIILSKVV